MKSLKHIYIVISMLIIASMASCELENIPDPNNADQNSIETNATLSDIQLLVNGTEDLMRSEMGFYYDVLGIIGREYYFFTNSDPRYTGEILGKAESSLDTRGFYGTRPYAARYRTIKNANILITAVENTPESLSDTDKNGLFGFAKTVQAYSFLLVLNMQYQNGIRMDVSDPENLGPFIDYTTALANISNLLDDANTNLTTAGSSFVFTMSNLPGNPSDFSKFNRAIKARVELYRGNNAAVLTALTNSSMDLAGNLDNGPSHFYSLAGNDKVNPMYRVPDQSEALVAHPSFITDAQAGDNRINKTTIRTSTAVLDGLSGDFDLTIYSGFEDPIPIIRNEELILMYAEANIGTNNAEAINAIDIIRTAHGLSAYAGGTTDAELIDELLYNRRYSLIGEAHRWIDMRRFGRLNQLPLDRVGDDVWEQFPRPAAEGE